MTHNYTQIKAMCPWFNLSKGKRAVPPATNHLRIKSKCMCMMGGDRDRERVCLSMRVCVCACVGACVHACRREKCGLAAFTLSILNIMLGHY